MSSTTEAGKAGMPGVHLTGDRIIQETTLQYLKAMQDEWGVPGVSLAIVRMNEDKQWDKQTIGMGRKDVEGDQVTEQTLFSIASNSKLFTAISTGLLLSESNLSWDTPVQEVIPSFQLMDKETEERTTFIELLSHQTGLPRHGLSYDTDITPEDVVRSLAYLKPSAPFKSCYQYTNLTYVAASLLPKQVLGQHLEEFVQKNIWIPLGMTQSCYNIEVARSTGNISSGFARKLSVGQSGVHDVERCKEDIKHARGKLSEEGRGMEHSLGWPVQQLAGPGGVITSAKDLTIWLQTLLLKGRHPDMQTQIIPSWIIEDTIKPQVLIKAKPDDPEMSGRMYGLGQEIYTYRGHQVIDHPGRAPGQKSFIIRLPDKMIGVAVMCNDDEFGDMFNEVAKWRVIDDLLGLDPIDFKTRKLNKFFEGKKPQVKADQPCQRAPPYNGFGSIPGVYRNAAYGNLKLRPLSSTHQDDTSLQGPNWSFVADVNKAFVKEFLFEHFDKDIFNVSAKLTFPETGAVMWDMIGQGIEARFGEGGMGFQHIWGAGGGVSDGNMERDGIRQGSEVFFTKVT